MSDTPPSIEQMVRDLLTLALQDHLVDPCYREWDDPDPQCRTSGELAGVANLLQKYLADQVDETARRIVACVNACRDLPTEFLEKIADVPDPDRYFELGVQTRNASDARGR